MDIKETREVTTAETAYDPTGGRKERAEEGEHREIGRQGRSIRKKRGAD